MSDYRIKTVLRKSEKVNFDGLFETLLFLDDLEVVKRDLLQAYFIVSEWCTEDSCNISEISQNALRTLRNILEALQDTDKPEQAKIRLSAR